MAAFEFVGPERKGFSDRWRTVRIGERTYQVGVERGNRSIRIPYRKARGWHWYGVVRDEHGKQVWRGQVGKSAGVRGILKAADLIGKEAGNGQRPQ